MDSNYGNSLNMLAAKMKAQKLILKQAKQAGDQLAAKRAEKEIKRLGKEIDKLT